MMTEHYEALRAHATGGGTLTTAPRGLVILMRAGVAGWSSAMRQLTDTVILADPWRDGLAPKVPLPDLALLLAEMVLNRSRTCPL